MKTKDEIQKTITEFWSSINELKRALAGSDNFSKLVMNQQILDIRKSIELLKWVLNERN